MKSFVCISDFLLFNKRRRELKKYRDYNPEDLEKAVRAVELGMMNSYEASCHFNVPRGTVAYRFYKKSHTLKK